MTAFSSDSDGNVVASSGPFRTLRASLTHLGLGRISLTVLSIKRLQSGNRQTTSYYGLAVKGPAHP